MNPTFLRRFGAALVCSLALTTLAAPVAFATDDAAPNADAAKSAHDAKPDAAKPDAAKADAAKPDAAKTDAAKTDAAKQDAGKADDAKSAVRGGAATTRPTPDEKAGAAANDDTPKRGNKSDDAGAKRGDGKKKLTPAEAVAKAKAEAEVPASTLKAREEAAREGRRNGARSKAADGTMLIWDNVNSVWIAAEPKHTYWVDDRFYRNDQGVWLTSKLAKGPWELTASHLVPEAPRGRHDLPKSSVTVTLPSGQEAVFDTDTKVFKVAGNKGVFLVDGVFWRYDGGLWLESKSPGGPWAATTSVALPQTLRRALPAARKGARVTLPSGEVLVSEGQPNLFGVEGKPDVLFYDGTFYERRDQKWFHSTTLSSSEWKEISSQQIPGMVRSNYHAQDKAAGKPKGGKQKDSQKKKDAPKKKGVAHDDAE